MSLRQIIKKATNFVWTYISTPLSIVFSIFLFTLRYIFLGYSNAINYLSQINQPSIVPILRMYGAAIGKNCDIGYGIKLHNCKNFKNLLISENCHIGKNCFLDLRDKIHLEKNVVISMGCSLITHIDLNKSDLSKKFPASSAPVYIRKNVYIGADCTVLMGVEIGENCFVGAKSLVNKSVQNNNMVMGVPAKIIKQLG